MLYYVAYFPSDLSNQKVSELRSLLDRKFTYSESDFEYLFVVGGDGSFIHFAKEYAFKNKKIIGVKGGTVSFLARCDLEKTEEITLLLDESKFTPLELLEIKGNGQVFYAVNDVYISGGLFLETDISINDIYFQKYRGSGLLISTKLGSTAKNKSLDGAILFPSTNTWLVNGIGSQRTKDVKTFANSLIFSDKEKVSFKNLNDSRIYLDGKLLEFSLNNIEISLITASSQILFNSTNIYIDKLKDIFIDGAK